MIAENDGRGVVSRGGIDFDSIVGVFWGEEEGERNRGRASPLRKKMTGQKQNKFYWAGEDSPGYEKQDNR